VRKQVPLAVEFHQRRVLMTRKLESEARLRGRVGLAREVVTNPVVEQREPFAAVAKMRDPPLQDQSVALPHALALAVPEIELLGYLDDVTLYEPFGDLAHANAVGTVRIRLAVVDAARALDDDRARERPTPIPIHLSK